MIYLDTSVALAHIMSEDRTPPAWVWDRPLVSSRLLEYESWTRVHSRRLADSHGEVLRQLLGRVAFLELTSPVLFRALEPFPVAVRTLDALHLASMEWLRTQKQEIELASYDEQLLAAARRMKLPIAAI